MKSYIIKRVKPFYKEEWLKNVEKYINGYEFWHDGIIEELETKFKQFIHRKHALAVNSVSNAMYMALYVWSKIYPNKKEVIIPNWGYPSAWKACMLLGLEPVPVDINIYTLGINNIESVLNYNTLAVVHIENNGIVGDPESIKNNLTDDILFIEDSAPSMLQLTAGTYGDVSLFSFSPTKPMMSGEGAIMLMDNDSLYMKLKQLRHAPNYNNREASLNFMLSPFLAAYLLPQFEYLDEIAGMRNRIHMEYIKHHLSIFVEPYESSNNHGSIMYLHEKAKQISHKLTTYGIEHRHKHYPCYSDDNGEFPVSCGVRDDLIDLPIHHELTNRDIEFICNIVIRGINE